MSYFPLIGGPPLKLDSELTESSDPSKVYVMAELLEPTGEYVSERRQYPWDEWLDGRPRRLTMDYPDRPGDFVSEPKTFRPYIYAVARNRNLKIVISIDGDDIILQSYEPGARRPTLPIPGARLANGKRDKHAPLKDGTTGATAKPLREGEACRHCGRKLTPYGYAYGECRQVKNEAFRCPENPNVNEEYLP